MLFKIKINVIVDLLKNIFIWVFEYLLGKKQRKLIIEYAWTKYSNAFILKKYFKYEVFFDIFYIIMTQWVTEI